MASFYSASLFTLPVYPASTPPAINAFTLDQTTDAAEWIDQHRGPGDTITHIGFRYSLRTGTPPTFKISFQGVGTTGNPNGTILGGGTPASATFTPPADATWDGTWQWIQLDNSIALTRGQVISIVIAYSSGTINGSNSSAFSTLITNTQGRGGYPYAISNNNGTRTRNQGWPIIAWKSSTAVYGFPLLSFTQTQYSSDSTPDEYALAFSLPSGSCSSYQLAGCRIWLGNNAAASKTGKIILYDTDGTTILCTLTIDSDAFVVGGATADRTYTAYFQETTLPTLSPGSTYYLSLQAQETASNWSVTVFNVSAAADLGGFPMGTAWTLATKTNGGSFSPVTTSRPMIEPMFADITGGSGFVPQVFE